MNKRKVFLLLALQLCVGFVFALDRPFVIMDVVHTYNLDPHKANSSADAQVLTGLYEGLFVYDPYSLEPTFGLIEDYKVSRDKLRWTFYLQENLTFSNEEPITAETVKNSWIELLNPKESHPFASLFDCVQGAAEYRQGKATAEDVGIVVQGDYKISLILNAPAEHLPSILCHHAFSVVHQDKNVFSGPYCIESQEGNTVILKKNPFYYDKDNVALEEIHFIQSDDPEENAYLFNTGRADWVISNASIPSIIDKQSIYLTAEFATEYLFFKVYEEPWNRADFRNALLTATPWEELRSQAFIPASTLIIGIGNYVPPAGLFDYDIDEARYMLAEAKKNAGMAEDAPLEITIAVSDYEYAINQALLLMDAWSQLGITVNVSKTPMDRYLDSVEGWDADIFSYIWLGDFADPLSFLELFRSDSTLNVTGWKNETFDDLLQQASRTSGTERFELLSKAEDVLLSDGLIFPVSHPVTLNVVDPAVSGWSSNALDIHPLKYLDIKPTQQYIPNLVMAP